MAKSSISGGTPSEPVHTRTTAGSEDSQVVILGVDGSDTVVDSTTLANQAKQDTANTGIGAPADAAATGNGSIIAIAKQLRVLLSGGLPAALDADGGLKVHSQTGNTTLTLLSSAARTATATPVSQTNTYGSGVLLFLNITATPNNAETLTPSIEWIDPVTGTAVFTLKGFTAITASTLGASPSAGSREFMFCLYPGAVDASATDRAEVVSGPLPRIWQARVTHSAGGSWTYSLGASVVA